VGIVPVSTIQTTRHSIAATVQALVELRYPNWQCGIMTLVEWNRKATKSAIVGTGRLMKGSTCILPTSPLHFNSDMLM